MKKQAMALAFLITTSAAVSAAEINGYTIPDTLNSATQNKPLVLVNAASQNYYQIQNAYISSTYRTADTTDPDGATESVNITVTAERFSGRGLGMSVYDAVFLENDWSDAIAFEKGLDHFIKMLDQPLNRGDTLAIEFTPQQGANIYIRGILAGNIQGDNWFKAVAASWIQPDTDMESGMMQASN
jgi:hypothetical protein